MGHIRYRRLCFCLCRLPLVSGELVEFRSDSLSSDVFLQRIQLVHRNVQHIRSCVLDLKEIPLHALDYQLLDACELADAVTFMDDIISFLHVREALDRTAASGGFRTPAAFAAASEDITFPDVADLLVRQFHSCRDHTALNADMTRFKTPRKNTFIEMLVLHEFEHVVFSFFRAADDAHVKPPRDIPFDIGAKLIHMPVVLGHLSCLHLTQFCQIRAFGCVPAAPYGHDKRREYGTVDVSFFRQLIYPEKIVLTGKFRKVFLDPSAAFQETFDLVIALFDRSIYRFEYPGRIVDDDLRSLQIVPDVGCLIVEIPKELFEILEIDHIVRILQKLVSSLSQSVPALRFLRFADVPVVGSPDPAGCLCKNLRISGDLGALVDGQTFEILDGALAFQLKGTDGIDFCIEEFDAVWVLPLRCEDIYDTAPDAVFASGFDHRDSLITHP